MNFQNIKKIYYIYLIFLNIYSFLIGYFDIGLTSDVFCVGENSSNLSIEKFKKRYGFYLTSISSLYVIPIMDITSEYVADLTIIQADCRKGVNFVLTKFVLNIVEHNNYFLSLTNYLQHNNGVMVDDQHKQFLIMLVDSNFHRYCNRQVIHSFNLIKNRFPSVEGGWALIVDHIPALQIMPEDIREHVTAYLQPDVNLRDSFFLEKNRFSGRIITVLAQFRPQ